MSCTCQSVYQSSLEIKSGSKIDLARSLILSVEGLHLQLATVGEIATIKDGNQKISGEY